MASALRPLLRDFGFVAPVSQLRLRGSSFAAFAFRPWLYGCNCTASASWLRHCGFGFVFAAAGIWLRLDSALPLRLCSFDFTASTSRRRLRGFAFLRRCGFGFAASAPQLWLTASASRILLCGFGFAGLAFAALGLAACISGLCFAASASPLTLAAGLRGFGFMASPSRLRLRRSSFAALACKFRDFESSFAASALRLQLRGFDFAAWNSSSLADASLAPLTLRRCADFTLRRFASRLLELAALALWSLLISWS